MWETTYTYDEDRNPTLVSFPDGDYISVGYDAFGRLSDLTTAEGVFGYTYNAAGQVSSITSPTSDSLTLTYDGSLPNTISWGGSVTGTVDYDFDTNLNVQNVKVNGSGVTYSYDNDELLTQAGAMSVTRSAASGFVTGTTLGSVTSSMTYNGFGEMDGDTVSYSGSPIYETSYTRDLLGRITSKSETVLGVTSTFDYSYDTRGRLVTVEKDTLPFESYTYDDNGNRLEATVDGVTTSGSYDGQDRLLSYGSTSYSYSENGDLLSKTEGTDTTTYDYDEFGALRSVTLPDTTVIDYIIDPSHRRVGRKVNGVFDKGWLYQDSLKPAAEIDGTGTVTARFVYAFKANVPEYIVKGGNTYRVVTDHLGSVRLVVDVATGTVAEQLDYDSYGRVITDTNPGFQPFGFAGGVYDSTTGLVRFGARDYDAEIGRWTGKDPIGLEGGLNTYRYASSNPLNFLDPDGLAVVPGDFADPFDDWMNDDPAFAHLVHQIEDSLNTDIYLLPGPNPHGTFSPGASQEGVNGWEIIIDTSMIGYVRYHTFPDPDSTMCTFEPTSALVTLKQVITHELLHLKYRGETNVILNENRILRSRDPSHIPRDPFYDTSVFY